MISDDSFDTTVPYCLSHNSGTVTLTAGMHDISMGGYEGGGGAGVVYRQGQAHTIPLGAQGERLQSHVFRGVSHLQYPRQWRGPEPG